MSLSVGLDVALSGLSTTAEQTAIVSRNVANAGDSRATHKIANVVTAPGGGVRLASVTRAANAALLENMLGATSAASAQKTIVKMLDRLDQTVDDPELDVSPGAAAMTRSRSLERGGNVPLSEVCKGVQLLTESGRMALQAEVRPVHR